LPVYFPVVPRENFSVHDRVAKQSPVSGLRLRLLLPMSEVWGVPSHVATALDVMTGWCAKPALMDMLTRYPYTAKQSWHS
jgi:hypothetical protein